MPVQNPVRKILSQIDPFLSVSEIQIKFMKNKLRFSSGDFVARWPSGLRRCVQVAVLFEGVGSNPTLVKFLSFHFWIFLSFGVCFRGRILGVELFYIFKRLGRVSMICLKKIIDFILQMRLKSIFFEILL